MAINSRDKGAVLVAAAIIYNRKVGAYMALDTQRLQRGRIPMLGEGSCMPPIGEIARDAAGEATVLYHAVEKHLSPKQRKGGGGDLR